MKKVLFEIV